MSRKNAGDLKSKLKGVFEKVSKRRDEELENLNSDENNFAQNPEDFARRKGHEPSGKGGINFMENEANIITMARNAFAKNKVEEFRQLLETFIGEQDEELKADSKKIEKYLKIFDNEIEALKKGEIVKKIIEDVQALEKHINETLQDMRNSLKKITDNISSIGENSPIFNDNYKAILSVSRKDLTTPSGRELKNLTECLTYAVSLKEEYKRLTGKEVKINYLTEQEVEMTLGLLGARRKVLIDQINKDNTKKASLTPILNQIDSLVSILPSLLENPAKFEEIKRRVGFDNQMPTNEDEKVKFERELSLACGSLEEAIERFLLNFDQIKNSLDVFFAWDGIEISLQEIDQIVSKYPTLSPSDKEREKESKKKEIYRRIDEKFGKQVYSFCQKYTKQLFDSIGKLKSFEYDSQFFELARSETKNIIAQMQVEGLAASIIVAFDEETQKLSITFPNTLMPKYEIQIVKDSDLQKMIEARNNKDEAQKQEQQCKEYLYQFYTQKYGIEYEILASLYTKQGATPTEPQLDGYPLVSDDLKQLMKREIEEEARKDFEAKYPKEFRNYLWELSQDLKVFRDEIARLNRMSMASPSVVSEYKKLIEQIKKKLETVDTKFIKKASLENEQTLRIEFAEDRLPAYTEEIISNAAKKLIEENDRKNGKAEQMEECRQYYATYFVEEYRKEEELLKSLYPTIHISKIPKEFPLLTKEEVETIANEEEAKVKLPFEQKYPESFRHYIASFGQNLRNIRRKLNVLSQNPAESDTLRYDYDKVTSELQALITNADKTYIQNIVLENQNTLKITFVNDRIPPYQDQIVPAELQQKMKKPSPGPTPGGGAGGSQPPAEDEKQAIENYIHAIEEINELIKAINDLNNTIFWTDITAITTAINAEAKAQELEAKVMDLRINLSQNRLDFHSKFGKYITTMDAVKNCKIMNVEFPNTDLDSFMNNELEAITEAEEKVIELAQERENAPEDRVNEINDQIKAIIKYIDARNAYANRRLVEESRVNKIDIVAALQDRRKRKQEIRQKLEQIRKGQKVPPKKQSTPSGEDNNPPKKEENGISVDVETPTATIKNQRFVFNPRNKAELVDREKDFITKADHVTISLIKSGIKIKYSQQLKEKLSQLNAKLSLVNKNNLRSRTSSKVDASAEQQVVSFEDGRDLMENEDYKNYKVEIRIPEGNKTNVLFEYDFDPEDKEAKHSK